MAPTTTRIYNLITIQEFLINTSTYDLAVEVENIVIDKLQIPTVN